MGELPFHRDAVRALADARSPLLTAVFQLFTFVGEIEGYVLVVALVFVAFDKDLAFRLAVLALVTMALNHALKMVVQNPRPFVAEGSHLERWAVSAEKARELAGEYSTPSGHAMAGAAFYAFLYATVRRRALRIACAVLILGTGLSRPWLGVHYVEDVLLGWAVGIAIAWIAVARGAAIGARWSQLSHGQQAGVAAGASAALWLGTLALCGGAVERLPTPFVSYAGLLTGIVVARPLEAERVGFDPRSGGAGRKLLRLVIAVVLVMGTLSALDAASAALASEASAAGHLLRYVRHALAGFAGLYLAPLLFLRLGLAAPLPR